MRESAKKLYSYISLTLVLMYFIFVLLMYNNNDLPVLYDLKNCGFYYMFVYILLVGVGYFIDTQTRKEPALITLFTIPAFSFILLLAFFIMGEVYWVYYLFLVLVFIPSPNFNK